MLHFTNLFCFQLQLPGNQEPSLTLKGMFFLLGKVGVPALLRTPVTAGDPCTDAMLLGWLQEWRCKCRYDILIAALVICGSSHYKPMAFSLRIIIGM